MGPRDQSATERRELRRKIRNVLGTSREEAPGAMEAIMVVQQAQRLLELATGGELSLRLEWHHDGGHVDFVDYGRARRLARGEEG